MSKLIYENMADSAIITAENPTFGTTPAYAMYAVAASGPNGGAGDGGVHDAETRDGHAVTGAVKQHVRGFGTDIGVDVREVSRLEPTANGAAG